MDTCSVSELSEDAYSEDMEVTQEEHLKTVGDGLTNSTRQQQTPRTKNRRKSGKRVVVAKRLSKIMMSSGGSSSNSNRQDSSSNFLAPKRAAPNTENTGSGGIIGAATRRQPKTAQHAQSSPPPKTRPTPTRSNSRRRVRDNNSSCNSSQHSSACDGGGSSSTRSCGGQSVSVDGSAMTGEAAAQGGDKSSVVSLEGLRSVVSNQTISSHDTVKASNKNQEQEQEHQHQQRIMAAFRRKRGNKSDCSRSSKSSSSKSVASFGGGREESMLPSVGEDQVTYQYAPKSKKRWGKLKRALGVSNNRSNATDIAASSSFSNSVAGASAAASAAASAPVALSTQESHHHFRMSFSKLLPARRHSSDINNKPSSKSVMAMRARSRSHEVATSSGSGQFSRMDRFLSSSRFGSSSVDLASPASRARSDPTSSTTNIKTSNEMTSRLDLERLDESIRGRMDGMDVMSLGSATRFTPTTACASPPADTVKTPTIDPWSNVPLHYSFAGSLVDYTPAQMVTDMLRASGGRSPPEIILEGFLPGGDDRWSVRIEEESSLPSTTTPAAPPSNNELQPSLTATTASSTGTTACGDSTATAAEAAATSSSSTSSLPMCGHPPDCLGSSHDQVTGSPTEPPPLKRAFTDEEYTTSEDGSPDMPPHKLWPTLWGSDPAPSHTRSSQVLLDEMNKRSTDKKDDKDTSALDDPLLHLAAESSIPIDIDEDTFIVSTREHLLAIEEIATVPLSIARFDSALHVYKKLCRGLDLSVEDDVRFLRGSARHNIGLIHMWMGNFQAASGALTRAEEDRLKYLPQKHPDVAVTQTRKAQALVALGRFDDALVSLEEALTLTAADQVVRAKVLNNSGVAYFLRGESIHALKCFTSALEIQRKWLQTGSVVRESIVYDASISLGNMGKLYCQQEIADFEMAAKVYKEALLLQSNIFHQNDDVVLRSAHNYAVAKSRCSSHSKGEQLVPIRLLQACLQLQQGVGLKYHGSILSILSAQTRKDGDVDQEEEEEDVELSPLRLQLPLASADVVETVGRLAYLYAQQAMYENALQCFEAVHQWQTANVTVATATKTSMLLTATQANIQALRAKTTTTTTSLDDSLLLVTNCCGGGGDTSKTLLSEKSNEDAGREMWI